MRTLHVIHHNDPDGICAAAIVARANQFKFFGDEVLPIIFYSVNYNKMLDFALDPDDQIVIVDFSYPPEQMKKLEEAVKWASDPQSPGNKNIIWIDHHATAERYGYQYKGLRDFTDKGFSGCELAWAYFFPDVPEPKAVGYIGDYDSWRLELENVFDFYEGIKIFGPEPQAPMWQSLLDSPDPGVEDSFDIVSTSGTICIKYRDIYCALTREKYGYETFLDGHKAFAMNLYGFGSRSFADLFDKYPLVIAYIYDGNTFTVSLYSKTIDVSEIAKAHGGGGHKGAAGFTCYILPFVADNLNFHELNKNFEELTSAYKTPMPEIDGKTKETICTEAPAPQPIPVHNETDESKELCDAKW